MCILCATPKTRLTYCFICAYATNGPVGALNRCGGRQPPPCSGAPCPVFSYLRARPFLPHSDARSHRYTCPPRPACALGVIDGCDGKNSVAMQATGLHFPFERDLRRFE